MIKWTDEQIEELTRLFHIGHNRKEIATMMGIEHDQVHSKIKQQKLKRKKIGLVR